MLTVHLDNVSKKFRLGTANEHGRLTEAVANSVRGLLFPRKSPGQMDAPMSNVEAQRLRDGWFWAVQNLNLEVNQGEILGVIGRNGAGKSTLLKLLSRIITPTSGKVGVRGRVGSLLEVGTGFHPELTGRENIYLNGSILGMSQRDIRNRFDAILEFADIGAFLDTPVKRYSSGMAVRLAFSVAAHLEPDVLIIDEVLAVGDQAFQDKCMVKARDLGKQGRTVLIVSHNLASVANLCTRAVYLRDGKLVEDGTPSQIIESYLQESVGASGTRIWLPSDRPSTEEFSLRSVSVGSGDVHAQTTSDVDIDRPVTIAIEYEVLRDDVRVTPGIRLKDETGGYVLWSTNAHSMCLEPDKRFGIPLQRGLFKAVCTIPPNFLNATRYFISLSLGESPADRTIDLENVISFLVHDTGAMRKEFNGNWTGPMIRPKLYWKTQQVDALSESQVESLTDGR